MTREKLGGGGGWNPPSLAEIGLIVSVQIRTAELITIFLMKVRRFLFKHHDARFMRHLRMYIQLIKGYGGDLLLENLFLESTVKFSHSGNTLFQLPSVPVRIRNTN